MSLYLVFEIDYLQDMSKLIIKNLNAVTFFYLKAKYDSVRLEFMTIFEIIEFEKL